jgi:Sulfatase
MNQPGPGTVPRTVQTDTREAPAEATERPDDARPPWRRAVAGVVTAAAFVVVFAALTAPAEPGQLAPAAFLRIPVEGLAVLALALVLPARARRIVAVLLGAGLGALTVLRALDIGFAAVLARPFDPVSDWSQLVSGISLVTGSAAAAVVIGIACAAVVVVGMGLAMSRLTSCAARHRSRTARALVALAAVWAVCFAFGVQVVRPVPVAARSVASYATGAGGRVVTALRDQEAFDRQIAVDPLRDAPAARLLTGLRGKDVVLTFVESYGRTALDDPRYASDVGAVLDDGTRRLRAAGYGARSAFLTSSVSGGGSWLAHATLQSGVRVTNQPNLDKVVATGRTTLVRAFRDAGWQTEAVMPSSSGAWPEAAFYGFDGVHDAGNLGNRARTLTGFQTPDQFTLAAFQRDVLARPGRGPVMAQIVLDSSHWPWTNVPQLVDWSAVGDGSGLDAHLALSGTEAAVRADDGRMREGYLRSIQYSLSSLISWVETYGDDNLVLVFLGDHQPAPFVTEGYGGRDVPVTVVARDPAVLDRIAGWGWQDGLRPAPGSPVWPMESFRDRFVSAFGD